MNNEVNNNNNINNKKIEYDPNTGQHIYENSNNGKEQIKNTTLSKIALVLTFCQIAVIFIAKYIDQLRFLKNIPYIIISLVLAIISRVKYNDKLSLIVIIVNTVLIILSIIMTIILAFFLAYILINIAEGCSDIG